MSKSGFDFKALQDEVKRPSLEASQSRLRLLIGIEASDGSKHLVDISEEDMLLLNEILGLHEGRVSPSRTIVLTQLSSESETEITA